MPTHLHPGYVLHSQPQWIAYQRRKLDGGSVAYFRGPGAPFRNVAPGGKLFFIEARSIPRRVELIADFRLSETLPAGEAWERYSNELSRDTLAEFIAAAAFAGVKDAADPICLILADNLTAPIHTTTIEASGARLVPRATKGWPLATNDIEAILHTAGLKAHLQTVSEEDAAGGLASNEELNSLDRAHRLILARRGQQAFRDSLRHIWQDRCAFSGTNVPAVLEAAHIAPYSLAGDNRPENGLLLRADIHTLFDLHLIGLEPDSLALWLHPDAAPEYAEHLYPKVTPPRTYAFDTRAVVERFKLFRETCGSRSPVPARGPQDRRWDS